MMTQQEIESIALPKWPALLVVGEPVTKEQAATIIVRTDSFRFSTNDRAFEKQLRATCGMLPEERGFTTEYARKVFQSEDEARQRYGVLPLEYLHNSRIVSCWIGGPKGWCSWGGVIGSGSFNIGKWPSTEEVLAEWKTIAAAFPFLKLRAQLLNGETCEEFAEPVIEYRVEGGTVTAWKPEKQLRQVSNDSLGELLMTLGSPGRERGCTIEQFAWALSVTERSLVA